jgi:hypothetical protein
VLIRELPLRWLTFYIKRLTPIYGQGKRQYNRLLTSLQRDLEPIGTLEEVLVEKIAQEYWRLRGAAWHAAEAFEKIFDSLEISEAATRRLYLTRGMCFRCFNSVWALRGDNQ